MYKIDSHIKAPRVKKARKCPDSVHAAFKAYSEAYKKVFGITPDNFTYDKATKFIRIGNSGGVSLMRLKEMTRQLELRAG